MLMSYLNPSIELLDRCMTSASLVSLIIRDRICLDGKAFMAIFYRLPRESYD